MKKIILGTLFGVFALITLQSCDVLSELLKQENTVVVSSSARIRIYNTSGSKAYGVEVISISDVTNQDVSLDKKSSIIPANYSNTFNISWDDTASYVGKNSDTIDASDIAQPTSISIWITVYDTYGYGIRRDGPWTLPLKDGDTKTLRYNGSVMSIY